MIYLVKSDWNKVHASADGLRPICGGGRGARAVRWQHDIGPANCLRCQHLTNSLKVLPPPNQISAVL
jgi:hypothetical protein